MIDRTDNTSLRAPHPRLDELVDELRASRRDLLQLLDELPFELRNQQHRDDGWTVAQIVEHLSIVESGSGRLITKLVRQARELGVTESEHESLLGSLDHVQLPIPVKRVPAPDFTHPSEGLSVEQAVERLNLARERLLQSIEDARGVALGAVSAPHPRLGVLDGYRWILATALHERRHTFQIRELARAWSRA